MRRQREEKRGGFWIWGGAVLCLSMALAGCGGRSAPRSPAAAKAAIAQGRRLYMTYGCAVCHGLRGDGKGMSAARFYPQPIDFHHPAAYSQGHDRRSIMLSIEHGSSQGPDSIMPAFTQIPHKDLRRIADYLVSLQNKRGHNEPAK